MKAAEHPFTYVSTSTHQLSLTQDQYPAILDHNSTLFWIRVKTINYVFVSPHSPSSLLPLFCICSKPSCFLRQRLISDAIDANYKIMLYIYQQQRNKSCPKSRSTGVISLSNVKNCLINEHNRCAWTYFYSLYIAPHRNKFYCNADLHSYINLLRNRFPSHIISFSAELFTPLRFYWLEWRLNCHVIRWWYGLNYGK